MGQVLNWARYHIHPHLSKDPTSSLAQHKPATRANNNQECSLLAHATVRPVPTHVPCHAPRRAYTRDEPHVRAPGPHMPMAAKVGSDTICNALEAKQLKSTLHAEQTTPTTIPLTLSSSLHVKGLTQGWGIDSRSRLDLGRYINRQLQAKCLVLFNLYLHT